MRRVIFSGKWLWAGSLVLLLPGVAAGQMATGPSSGVDGYLDVAPDAYGSWASATFGGFGDHFNPAGAHSLQEAAFTSGFMLFVGGTQRELLSDVPNWQGVFAADPSLSRSITSPIVFSDTTGNGVDDTGSSAFRVFGGTTDLGFDLVQRVRPFGSGVAFVQQDYTITNNGTAPIRFDLVRAFDGDLLWDSDFSNDEVGTSMHSMALGTYVFEQEAVAPGATAVTLSSPEAGSYYAGKHGITPPLGPPTYDYGTDTEVWDAFGIPLSWANHIAGVGYGIDGLSGAFPPGSTSPEDGFLGIGILVDDLGPGQSTTVTVFHTYGQSFPVPEPASLALLGLGALCLRRR